MSAESREKARRNGQKSGKGSEIFSRVVARVTGGDSEDECGEDR
jgi:hypothetical protein